MPWTPYVIAWMFLGVATLGLALYRKLLTMKEDDLIHIEDWKQNLVPQQAMMARKIDTIDRWGETLTVLTALGGLVLAAMYLYDAWQRSQGG